MADQNPTRGQRAVPLNLPASQIAILRDTLRGWLAGVRDDLKHPRRLRDPEQSRREAQAYERLLAGIGWGTIVVPDEEARAFLAAAARGNDEAGEQAEILAIHDALHGLLALLSVGPVKSELIQPLAARLRRLRADARLSRRELAEGTALNESEIASLETGEIDPDFLTLVKLADALGVRVAALFAGLKDESESDQPAEGGIQ